MYDMIVVGAGPAGLTAAIYARRAGKTVLVLERSTFGGQMTYSPKIENYPGFNEISGVELADRMVEQALALGAEIDPVTVSGVRRSAEDGHLTVVTDDGEREARAVVIAAGAAHRRLGLDGEDDLVGHGVSFCAVCDGAFYAGKNVAVVGGGNSAIVEAAMLADTAAHVTVVQNLGALTGEPAAAAALAARENVDIITNTVVCGYISEDGKLTGLRLRNTVDDKTSEIAVDGAFIAIGLAPENRPFADVASLDGRGYVISDDDCSTGTPGVFVAGECRVKRVRQISTAAADGAVAALAACDYIYGLSR